MKKKSIKKGENVIENGTNHKVEAGQCGLQHVGVRREASVLYHLQRDLGAGGIHRKRRLGDEFGQAQSVKTQVIRKLKDKRR